MEQQLSYLEEMAILLKNTIEKIFKESEKAVFAGETKVERKDLIEYDRRMLASGTDKFNHPAYVAAVNFYRMEKDREQHNACGAIVLYVKSSAVEQILKSLKIRDFDDEDDEIVSGKCAELVQRIAEDFKRELKGIGYKELVLSQAVGAKNSIMKGVEFSYDQYDRYEIGFTQAKQKIMVLDLTMTTIPRG